MPDFKAVAIAAARRNGINPNLFVRQINQESGFDPNARSGAGAVGIAQIVPHWHPGVDATDPVASLNYAAHLMGTLVRKYGNYQQALSVYNSGKPNTYKDPSFSGGQTFNYVKSIMGGSKPVADVAPVGMTPAPQFGLSGALRSSLTATDKMLGLPSIQFPALTAAPSFAPAAVSPVAGASTPAPAGNWVKVSPSANRAGIGLRPQVFDYVSQIAQVFGRPLTIGTGTNHNQYVAGSHRESAHWTGWAADIPASGSTLTRLGQDALIAAGAKPAWARRQKGGLFNVNGKQIIFNSMIGGNHFNHLHVGVR